MTAAVRGNLETLRDDVGAESLAEVIRRALTVYGKLVEYHQKGGTILVHLKDENREREIEILL